MDKALYDKIFESGKNSKTESEKIVIGKYYFATSHSSKSICFIIKIERISKGTPQQQIKGSFLDLKRGKTKETEDDGYEFFSEQIKGEVSKKQLSAIKKHFKKDYADKINKF